MLNMSGGVRNYTRVSLSCSPAHPSLSLSLCTRPAQVQCVNAGPRSRPGTRTICDKTRARAHLSAPLQPGLGPDYRASAPRSDTEMRGDVRSVCARAISFLNYSQCARGGRGLAANWSGKLRLIKFNCPTAPAAREHALGISLAHTHTRAHARRMHPIS